jgi:hypothetical protein
MCVQPHGAANAGNPPNGTRQAATAAPRKICTVPLCKSGGHAPNLTEFNSCTSKFSGIGVQSNEL